MATTQIRPTVCWIATDRCDKRAFRKVPPRPEVEWAGFGATPKVGYGSSRESARSAALLLRLVFLASQTSCVPPAAGAGRTSDLKVIVWAQAASGSRSIVPVALRPSSTKSPALIGMLRGFSASGSSRVFSLQRAGKQAGKLVEADARPEQGGEIECRHSHPPFEATTTECKILGHRNGLPGQRIT